MSWIRTIEPEEADSPLREIYDTIKGKRGKVADIMRIHSLNPSAMKTHMDLYLCLMFGTSGLTRRQREMIAVVVSSANRCDYCVMHHGESLRAY